MKIQWFVIALMLIFVSWEIPCQGNGTGSPSGGGGSSSSNQAKNGEDYQKAQEIAVLYSQGLAASKDADYPKAINYFQKVLEKRPDNPDALNMLAHSQRKIGLINEAIENYWKALKLRPNFPEAREYLGEAYIQATLQEMKTLKGYGKDGKEQLEDLTEAFKDAAKNIKD
jgi:tetratricopeptide (TPR) repeat protein